MLPKCLENSDDFQALSESGKLYFTKRLNHIEEIIFALVDLKSDIQSDFGFLDDIPDSQHFCRNL
jgi:hypothetical protein